MFNAPREEHRALTPIYPTLRFDAAAEATEKSEQRGDGAAAIAMPPGGD